jgi:hypothetical protein
MIGTPEDMTETPDCRPLSGRVASRMLRETSYPLAKVARQVGYESEVLLSRAFRKKYGLLRRGGGIRKAAGNQRTLAIERLRG